MYEYKCEYMNIHSDCSWQFAGITHVLQKRQYQLEKRTYKMNMIDLIEMQRSKIIKIDKIYLWYIRNNLTQAQCIQYKYICNIHFNFLFHCQTGIKISTQNLSLMSGLRAGAHCTWNQVRSLGSCGLRESLASQKFMPGELGSQDAKKGIRII